MQVVCQLNHLKRRQYQAVFLAFCLHAVLVVFLILGPGEAVPLPITKLVTIDFSAYDPAGGKAHGKKGPAQVQEGQEGNLTPVTASAQVSTQQTEKVVQSRPVSPSQSTKSKPQAKPLSKTAPVQKTTSPKRVEPKPISNPSKPVSTSGELSATNQFEGNSIPTGQGIASRSGGEGGEGGSGGGTGRGNPDVEKAYFAQVIKKMNRYKQYPPIARSRRITGVATVYFVLNRGGEVVESRLVSSSGNSALDKEAAALIKRASPFDAFPSQMPQKTLAVTAPIQFTLR